MGTCKKKKICFERCVEAKRMFAEVVNNNLYTLYIQGIEGFSDDGVTGLFDWVESTSIYSLGGLKNGSWTPMGNGDTLTQISTDIMNVLRNGDY